MFSNLSAPQQDPILSLSQAYRLDQRDIKVDLGIGVYKNSDGVTPIMQSVLKAQDIVLQQQQTKAYVGMAGDEEFNAAALSLVLPDTAIAQRATSIQTPGASGGLRMLAELIAFSNPDATVWLSNPSYVNHQPVMEAAGLKVKHYRYFDAATKQVDANAMLDDLAKVKAKDVVLLHGCCHNPTGADLSPEVWEQVTLLAQRNGFLPFIDIAYQGFGDGLEQDSFGVRHMAQNLPELLVTSSCSKNFGLYRERTGSAIIVADQQTHATNARGKLLQMARTTYTMPPAHGASIVKTVLQDNELKAAWIEELEQMRLRLVSLRHNLCLEISKITGSNEFDFIKQHKGMFSVLGYTSEQMIRLREEFAVYGVNDGRINIAGLREQDLTYVASAIAAVR
ncbi:aromatic amino acid aminotransferase [Vibrio sp. UCD-FRSSP16_10]|uniref:amino acid aminotransferase n=1 Tax=unclassified Vibrio TaxID=2614977 RepID=UPI0008006E05|nr:MULTISPECIES: amino acid aminotransferase [unclassified Vibrio]OBT07970.1 aromatic amino acid aminotransferase [Vibrio sp. UCD-FRSSP16_30]OBT17145.1 aromatic amino acid aminotransferase [Vibrio sp. UCD-FRSSP16_10]